MTEALFEMGHAGVRYDDRQAARDGDPRAYQRMVRDREAAGDPRPSLWALADCVVRPISRPAAHRVISRYEWLGHMRGVVDACYGLVAPGQTILGVTVFGRTANPRSGDICGASHRDLAICLRRGACAHDAPPHAASFLISRATQLAAKERGWRIFHAYADEEAGEIGTVYQACNWLYLGKFPTRPSWLAPGSERPIDERILRRDHGLTCAEARAQGWQEILSTPKHRYVHFEGSRTQRRSLASALAHQPLPYPKRTTA